jgi:hypothetical protein
VPALREDPEKLEYSQFDLTNQQPFYLQTLHLLVAWLTDLNFDILPACELLVTFALMEMKARSGQFVS